MHPTQAYPRQHTPRFVPQGESLEDFVGGRLLAWAGGVAVLASVVFLFAMAISRGWLDESARSILAGVASLGIAGLGLWLQERRRRTDAGLSAFAAGVAGLFVTVVVASRVYDLIPSSVGVGLALGVGAATTLVALRWEAQVIAALGLVGGLLAPLMTGAPSDGGTVAVMAATTLAAGAVCLRMRWTWLSCAVLALPAIEWVPYVLGADRPGISATVATLLAYGALGTAAAVGHDLRRREAGLPLFSAWLVAINSMLVTGIGWWALSGHSHAAADAWLVAMAITHLTLGIACRRSSRCAEDLSLVAFALATVMADVAIERLTSGVPTVFGWLAGALALGAVTRKATRLHERPMAELGLGVHVAVAIATALGGPASPMNGALTGNSAAVLLGLAATCLVTGRLVDAERRYWRQALDAVAMVAVAYLTALSLDGPALVAAWAAEAVALAGIARRSNDPVAAAGVPLNLALAGIHALVFEAAPVALYSGHVALGGAAVALGAFAAAAVGTGRLIGPRAPQWHLLADGLAIAAVTYFTALALDGWVLPVVWAAEAVALAAISRWTKDPTTAVGATANLALAGVHVVAFDAPLWLLFAGDIDVVHVAVTLGAFSIAALAAVRLGLGQRYCKQIGIDPRAVLGGAAALGALHLVSLEVVALFETTGTPIATGTWELPVHQQAQMALSATWAIAGVGSLIAGLVRDVRPLRLGALTLLGVVAGKVWIFDLARLDALYRVGSFLVLGLLLLAGSFAWQRIRPRPVPDLRVAPPAAR